MKNVSEFISFLLGSFYEEESPRVALYHYLKAFVGPQTSVGADTLNRFFADCLIMPHWQTKKKWLFQDIDDLLKKYTTQFGENFDTAKLWNVDRLQIVEISDPQNLFAIVKKHEQKQNSNDSLRLIPQGENVIVVKKSQVGGIVVRTYGPTAYVFESQLCPIGQTQELFYEPTLELKCEKFHRIRTTPYSQIGFIHQFGQWDVKFTSGFLFKLSSETRINNLSQDLRIFYPLKNLEKFYIYRPTDPYYRELMDTLDRAIQLSSEDSTEAQTYTRQAFACGQVAFDHIYGEDRGLYDKLRELASRLKPQRIQPLENSSAPVLNY